jgi:hypothetical protein
VPVSPEFSAEAVTLDVLAHLERRRETIVTDETRVREEVTAALVPVRTAYAEAELPPAYMDALAGEIADVVPARWRALADRFSAAERRDFGVWRGGDPIARLSYVLVALIIGGFIVWAPFIPIWDKWFPFLLAGGAWWLPNAQVAWHRRRYARALGAIAKELGATQPRLDEHIKVAELLLPSGENK